MPPHSPPEPRSRVRSRRRPSLGRALARARRALALRGALLPLSRAADDARAARGVSDGAGARGALHGAGARARAGRALGAARRAQKTGLGGPPSRAPRSPSAAPGSSPDRWIPRRTSASTGSCWICWCWRSSSCRSSAPSRWRAQRILRFGWRTDLAHFFVSHLLVQVLALLTMAPAALLFGGIVSPRLQAWVAGRPLALQFVAGARDRGSLPVRRPPRVPRRALALALPRDPPLEPRDGLARGLAAPPRRRGRDARDHVRAALRARLRAAAP